MALWCQMLAILYELENTAPSLIWCCRGYRIRYSTRSAMLFVVLHGNWSVSISLVKSTLPKKGTTSRNPDKETLDSGENKHVANAQTIQWAAQQKEARTTANPAWLPTGRGRPSSSEHVCIMWADCKHNKSAPGEYEVAMYQVEQGPHTSSKQSRKQANAMKSQEPCKIIFVGAAVSFKKVICK